MIKFKLKINKRKLFKSSIIILVKYMIADENKIKMQKSLDAFIQNCLNKFRFVEIKKELFPNIGEFTNLIISNKSIIPDLVIWNKSFNKYECFKDMKDSKAFYKYPRTHFYIKINNTEENIKKGKNVEQKIIEKKYENNNYENLVRQVDKLDLRHIDEIKTKKDKKGNEIDGLENCDKIHNKPVNHINVINNSSNNKDIFNNIHYISEKSKDNISFQNNSNNNYIAPVNQEKKKMNDFYQNQFKQNELLLNYVYSNLDKKGWILFTNSGDYLSNFTSFELFTFLTNILKRKGDVKMYIIGMQTDSLIFNGEQIYIILSQTLPIILQKKQLECEMMRKKKIKGNEDKRLLKLNDNEKENICNNYSPKKYDKNSGNVQEKDSFNKYQSKENNGYISHKYQL